MKLSNSLYDKLVFATKYVLPALGTLYFGLSEIWNLPYGVEVVGTIVAVETFLGVVLGISKSAWNKDGKDGVITLETKSDGGEVYSIEMANPIDTLKANEQVTLRVDDWTPKHAAPDDVV